MRRFALISFVVLMIISLVVVVLGNIMLPIATGFAAKSMCSCVFVAGRDQASVENLELARFAVENTRVKIYPESHSVEASVMGFQKQTALYREGLGCTLVRGLSADSLRNQMFQNPRKSLQTISNPYWPTGETDTLKMPADVDIAKVREAVEQAFAEDYPEGKKNTNAVVVVYKGKLIAEKYGRDFTPETPQRGWSMTKSITNALIGILVERRLADINELPYAPEWDRKENDPRKQITLDHLLRMSSGLKFNEMYGSATDVTSMLYTQADAGAYAASQPVEAAPNEVWNYSSGTTNIISRHIRSKFAFHDAYLAFPYEALFSKIGMASAQMEVDASGTYVGSSFCYATPRDWARLGLLFLNDGVWEGERILPEGWVDYSRTRTPTCNAGIYAAHFWTNATRETPEEEGYRYWPDLPEDLYYASGFDGQFVVIVPSRDLVVVRLGVTTDRRAFDIGSLVKGILNGAGKPEA